MDITATALLPYDDAEAARSALRARLQDIVERRLVPEAALEGATMLVAGPTVVADAVGRTWFQWVATLKTRPVGRHGRRADDGAPRHAVPDPLVSDDGDRALTVDDLGLLRRRTG